MNLGLEGDGSQTNSKSERPTLKSITLISSTLGHVKGLKNVLQLIQPTLRFNAVIALQYNEQERYFELIEQYGLSEKQFKSFNAILSYVSDYANQGKKPRSLPKNNGVVLNFTENEIKRKGISSIFVYYIIRSGRITGALIFCRNKGQFDEASFRFLGSIASLITLLAENKFYKEKALTIANSVNLDGLTGLYNHRHFQESLSNELLRAQRFRYPVSLLMIDVDNFKNYNDKYSHPCSDSDLPPINVPPLK
jgi:GGDEF domain-containing protein